MARTTTPSPTAATKLTTLEKAREISLPLLPLALVITAALLDMPLVVAGLSFLLFALTIRMAHDLHHNALRLPPMLNHLLLFATSMILFASMHAARLVHLRHHQSPLADDDLEGRPGRQGFFKALAMGMIAVPRLHARGLKLTTRQSQAWLICAETLAGLIMAAGWCMTGLALDKPLWVVPLAIAVAHLFSPMIAVWAVHHGLTGQEITARTQESRLFHTLTLGLMYHLEHHRYPTVATCRLGQIASMIRLAEPTASRPQIIPILKGKTTNRPHAAAPGARHNQTRRPSAVG